MLADMRTGFWKRPSVSRRGACEFDAADMGTVFGLEASLAEHAGEMPSPSAVPMAMPLLRRRSWWSRLASRRKR